MHRLVPCSLVALVSASAPTVTAQPGGGSPECWDLVTESVFIIGDCAYATECTSSLQIAIPGTLYKTVTSQQTFHTCRHCLTWTDLYGNCFVDWLSCGPWHTEEFITSGIGDLCDDEDTEQ